MTSILDKNIHDLVSGLNTTMFTSDAIGKRGLLQQLDPRVKMMASLTIIVMASIRASLPYLLFLYVVCLLSMMASRLNVAKMFRIWLILPFFSLFLSVPLIFSFVTPGQSVFHLFGSTSITLEGLLLAARFLLRIAVCVTSVQAVLFTTRWDHIMKAFEFFRVPPGVLFVLSLTYRYINVLLTAALDMMLARKSRTVGRQSAGAARNGIGIIVGNLMVKSISLSGEVRDAMVSRGYTGKIRTAHNFIFHLRDAMAGILLIGIIGIGFLSI